MVGEGVRFVRSEESSPSQSSSANVPGNTLLKRWALSRAESLNAEASRGQQAMSSHGTENGIIVVRLHEVRVRIFGGVQLKTWDTAVQDPDANEMLT